MVCIYCSGSTRVSNSRSSNKNFSVWRRRVCSMCKAVFTTGENPDLNASVSIKNFDGSLEPFSTDKVLFSIYSSCKHRKSPLEDARALTNTFNRLIINQITSGFVELKDVQDLISTILSNFDSVALTYYNAYYVKKMD